KKAAGSGQQAAGTGKPTARSGQLPFRPADDTRSSQPPADAVDPAAPVVREVEVQQDTTFAMRAVPPNGSVPPGIPVIEPPSLPALPDDPVEPRSAPAMPQAAPAQIPPRDTQQSPPPALIPHAPAREFPAQKAPTRPPASNTQHASRPENPRSTQHSR